MRLRSLRFDAKSRAIGIAVFACTCAILVLGAAAPTAAQTTSAPDRGSALAAYANLPISFEPNQGQTDASVQFHARGPGYALSLRPGEAVLGLSGMDSGKSISLRMHLTGANPDATVAGLERLSGTMNYSVGRDKKNWHVGIPTYGRVSYTAVYPGVDLMFYGNQRRLEYDFLVAPVRIPSLGEPYERTQRRAWLSTAKRPGPARPTSN